MNRKRFLRISGSGIGLTLIPQSFLGQPQPHSTELQAKIVRNKEGEVLNVIGDIQTHKLTGNETNNQLVEWVDNVPPGTGIPPHVHTKEDEVFRVVEGEIELMIDGKTSMLKAGDTAFAPKNIPHAWKVVGNQNAKMITSAFPAGIEQMFKELAELPAGPPDFEKVAAICGKHGIRFV